jgi:uncharacterized protein (TIGR02284 family)
LPRLNRHSCFGLNKERNQESGKDSKGGRIWIGQFLLSCFPDSFLFCVRLLSDECRFDLATLEVRLAAHTALAEIRRSFFLSGFGQLSGCARLWFMVFRIGTGSDGWKQKAGRREKFPGRQARHWAGFRIAEDMEPIPQLRALIQSLLETLEDGHKGFKTAAENIGDEKDRRLFEECAYQRAGFIDELKGMLQPLGEAAAEETGTVAGKLHRGWIHLEAALSNKDAHAILVECERGESCAVTEYERALALEMPAYLRELLSRQHRQIAATHQRIQALADAGAPRWA